MAKQIIILDVTSQDGGSIGLTYLFWIPVVAGTERPVPGLSSVYPGAAAQEITDLQAGKVIEEYHSDTFPNTFSAAQIKASLLAQYTARKAYLSSLPAKGAFYGVFYDGAAWSA